MGTSITSQEVIPDDEVQVVIPDNEVQIDDSDVEVDQPGQKSGSITDALLSGLLKGGARNLQDIQNLINLGVDNPTGSFARGSSLVTGVRNKLSDKIPQVFGDMSKDTLSTVENNIPKTEGFINNIVEGAAEVPSYAAELALLKGVPTPVAFGLQGAVQGYDEKKISGSIIGGLVNSIFGVALEGIGMIKPSDSNTILKKMSGLATGKLKEIPKEQASNLQKIALGSTRVGLSGGLGALTSYLSGEKGDEVAAQAILYGYLGRKPSDAMSWSDLSNVPVKAIQKRILELREPIIREKVVKDTQRRKSGDIENLKQQKSKLEESASSEMSKIDKSSSEQMDIISTEQQARLSSIKEKESLAKSESDKAKIDLKVNQIAQQEAEKIKLSNQLRNISEQSSIAIKSRARELQPEIVRSFGELSSNYGTIQDKVADSIDQNENLKIGEVREMLLSAKDESIKGADVTGGQALKRINDLLETKYNLGDNLDNPRMEGGKAVVLSPDSMISFKEVLSDMRSVFKTAKYGRRSRPEDIPSHILRSKWGDYVESKDPSGDFKSLNASYRDAMSYVKRASQMFSVYKGEAYTDSGEKILKRLSNPSALKKITGAEERTLEFIEKGSEKLGGGLGDVFSQFKNIASQKALLKESSLSSQRDIESQYESNVEKVKTNYEARLGELSREADNVTRMIESKKSEISKASEKRKVEIAKELKSKIENIDKQLNLLETRKSQLIGTQNRLAKIRDKNSFAKKALIGVLGASLFASMGAFRISASRIANTVQGEFKT